MKELAAVIVETRPLKNLAEIIENHLKYLPDYTRLYVFGSVATEAIVDAMNIDYVFVRVDNVINETKYNRLLTSFDFWNAINEENILIFQHDSEILREGIEDFYEWDYVGAPWKFQNHGGNGGLSFRKKSAMISILRLKEYNIILHGNEDIYFSNHAKLLGFNLAPREVCEKFSCETIFKLGTFGCHAINKWMPVHNTSQIRTQYGN